MELSIIIPCYQEEEAVPQLHTKLEELRNRLSCSHEYIFVDDGSTDTTPHLLEECFQNGFHQTVKIFKHETNRGPGGALRTGLNNARGEYLAVMDSDCTYEPLDLIEMLARLREANADMITVSPYHPEGKTLGVPSRRLFLSHNLSKLYNLILGFNIYTYTAMVRVYRKSALENISFTSDGFLAMAEILIKLVRGGYRVIEFPATLKVRKYGTSSARVLKIIGEHLGLIARIILKKE